LIENEAARLKRAVVENLEKYGEDLVVRGLEQFWDEPNIEKIVEILAITHEGRWKTLF
jgi:hypothetical protein